LLLVGGPVSSQEDLYRAQPWIPATYSFKIVQAINFIFLALDISYLFIPNCLGSSHFCKPCTYTSHLFIQKCSGRFHYSLALDTSHLFIQKISGNYFFGYQLSIHSKLFWQFPFLTLDASRLFIQNCSASSYFLTFNEKVFNTFLFNRYDQFLNGPTYT
jgi:hypothetical protein